MLHNWIKEDPIIYAQEQISPSTLQAPQSSSQKPCPAAPRWWFWTPKTVLAILCNAIPPFDYWSSLELLPAHYQNSFGNIIPGVLKPRKIFKYTEIADSSIWMNFPGDFIPGEVTKSSTVADWWVLELDVVHGICIMGHPEVIDWIRISGQYDLKMEEDEENNQMTWDVVYIRKSYHRIMRK